MDQTSGEVVEHFSRGQVQNGYKRFGNDFLTGLFSDVIRDLLEDGHHVYCAV